MKQKIVPATSFYAVIIQLPALNSSSQQEGLAFHKPVEQSNNCV
jgi:hypothetical protein